MKNPYNYIKKLDRPDGTRSWYYTIDTPTETIAGGGSRATTIFSKQYDNEQAAYRACLSDLESVFGPGACDLPKGAWA